MIVTANKNQSKPKRRLPPEPLTPDECRRMLLAAGWWRKPGRNKGPSRYRERALIVLLWRAGLRISEALSLAPRDLDPELLVLRVRFGKGSKYRVAAMDEQAWKVVNEWMAVRRELGIGEDSPLICSLKGRSIDRRDANHDLKRTAKGAGIAKRVHAHGLRHSHACELMREGMPINLISRQLGHRSIATTVCYLDHISPLEVVKAVGARQW